MESDGKERKKKALCKGKSFLFFAAWGLLERAIVSRACVSVSEREVERQKMRRHAGQAAVVSAAAAAAWVVVVLTARSQSENTGALYFRGYL